jgi:hypothetical protein
MKYVARARALGNEIEFKSICRVKSQVHRIIDCNYLIHFLTHLHNRMMRLSKCLPALGNNLLRTRFASIEYLQSENSLCNALNASHRFFFYIGLPSSNCEHAQVPNAPKLQRNVIKKFPPPKFSPSTTSQLPLLFCSHPPNPSSTALYTQ